MKKLAAVLAFGILLAFGDGAQAGQDGVLLQGPNAATQAKVSRLRATALSKDDIKDKYVVNRSCQSVKIGSTDKVYGRNEVNVVARDIVVLNTGRCR